MDISKRIVIVFVAVSLIPILVISAVSGLTIFGVSNDNAADSAAALESEELANVQRIAGDTALFIDERMQQYFDGVFMMEDYSEALFNNRMNATPQDSYWWNPVLEAGQGHPVPGLTSAYYDIYESTQISFDVSCYYMPREFYNNPSDPYDLDPATQYFVETSSNMDNIYRSLRQMNEDYIWLYMGIDSSYSPTHLFRNYPYDNLEYFWDWYEDGTDYDHMREDWYTNAVGIMDNTSLAFTGPYGDPSTGLVLSMGRPVHFDNNSLYGVVSADVTLDTMISEVTNIQILDSGYAFLLTDTGQVVSHRDFTTEGQSIYDLEFGSETSSEAQDFTSVLGTVLSTSSGVSQFQKDGESWYIAHSTANTTGFVLAVVVPYDEVVEPANDILSLVQANTLQMTIILAGVLAFAVVAVGYGSYSRGQAVVKPIKDMTRLVEKMAQQDFTRGLHTSGAMFEEVGTTVDALLSFQEAVRFGNQAFIRGDLNRALANYQNLLEISERLNIDVGIQTMLLNIGNVFRQRGDPGNAMDYYKRSLAMANEMLERAKEQSADESDAMSRIASVYHNMALVEMDNGNYDESIRHLDDAAAIDLTIGNKKGLARRFDATGLVRKEQGMYSEAFSKFREALQTAQEIDYERSQAFIHYHMGELYVIQDDWKNAEDEFQDAIRIGQRAEEGWLVVYAMQQLADVLDQLDKPSHDVRREAERLRRSIMFKKSVIFVIDYSGSMRAQDRIKAAVQGAKEILDSQVNPQDEVSIIVFNSGYREILPLTLKGHYDDPSDSPIVRALDSLRYPNNATAFYDALGSALESLDRIESSEHRWVIALTDGEDNSSDTYSLDLLSGIRTERDRQKRTKARTIEGFIRGQHLDVNLIIIGVGQELRKAVEGHRDISIEQLLESICEYIPQGQYLSVVDSIDVKSDIERAFQQVGVLMAQLEMGGSTVDY
ncbi:MAG: tetratricopeptide repeat protein [Candidatus Thorarchaeota archaeon]|nr:MAG: tetratricopeptide repeat protein [Candidatus Thorarchaeota archaeon]